MSRARTPAKTRAERRNSAHPKAPSREPRPAARGLNAALAALLAAVTIALYSPVIGHSFLVLDDHDYVTANPHIHEGLSWHTIKWAFTSTEAANWHPLTWLSHALDYQLFALNSAGHHFSSILMHALNAALLFLLLAWATKRLGPSLMVASLFAVHPLNVESVAWIAERKNVLSTLFFFLAIAAYARYAQKPRLSRYLLVAALFAAGLMAKPMVITLPLVLLLLDYWPLERTPGATLPPASNPIPRATFSRLVLEKIPLLFLSAGSAWITLFAQRPAERSIAELPFALRSENAVLAYALYLLKMIWPARLAFYPHPVSAPPAWQWILSALVLIVVTAFVVRFRSKRYLPFGWLWFLVTLIPVIGLVQVGEYAMADRYAYIPLIGIFIMISWGLADLARANKLPALWLAIPALCVLAALACVTWRQIDFWQSDYDLWSHTLEGAENPMAYNALAMTLMHPDTEMTTRDLESFTTQQSRMDQARGYFERALELRQPQAQQDPAAYLPDMARTLNNLGSLDRLQNRPDDARQHSERALQIYRQLAAQNPDVYRPYLAATLSNLGTLDRRQNRMYEARWHFQEALQIDRQLGAQNPVEYLPNIAMTLNELGFLDASQNRLDEAGQHYDEALKIDRQLAQQSPAIYLRDLAMTLTNFGLLDAFQQRLDEARGHFEEALKIDRQLAQQDQAVYLPDVAMTLSNLARVDRLQNRIEESRAHYTEAASIYRQLSQSDPARYAANAAQVEAALKELH
ncbi:MAG: tetratricopeptide repeat protein [Terracidiphilus sp.]|jgi:Tfp pilus assembly protein PilF